MSSSNGSGTSNGVDAIGKLKTDMDILAHEATAGDTATFEDQQTQLRMKATIDEQLSRPATINSIQVHGAKNTRRGFLDPILKPILSETKNAGTTLGDVLARLQEATAKLERLEIFRPEPTVFISDARASDPLAAGTDLDISIKVAEKGRFMLKTGTDLGNAEGSAYGNLLWRNMFGGAESLSLNASAGTRTRSAYSAVFSTPIRSDPHLRFSLEGLQSSTQKPWASHEEEVKSGTARLNWVSASKDSHSLACSSAWRQVTGLAPTASPTVRRDAGDSVKNSISYSYTRDRRDNPLLPQSGYLVRTLSELAGGPVLGGDVAFSKSEMELAGAIPLPLPGSRWENSSTGVSVGGGLRFGMLYPLARDHTYHKGEVEPSRVNDRFHLGGPTDVRGFCLGGLGPRDGRDSIGGDMFAAAAVSLLLPLPRTGPESPLRLQLFANAGRNIPLIVQPKSNLLNSSRGKGWPSDAGVKQSVALALREMVSRPPSLSTGIGLVYAHPVARFELNFSLPIIMRRNEESRKGLQFGVGIDFM